MNMQAIRKERAQHMENASFDCPVLALHALRHELQGATVTMQGVPMRYNASADTWQYMGEKPLTLWAHNYTTTATIPPFAPIDTPLFLFNFAQSATLPTI